MAATRPGLLRLTLALAAALFASRAPAAAELGAADHFELCATCHGAAGEGKPNLQAPAIAGLPAWYVEKQLAKFQAGVRGAHPDDHAGLRMRPMSRYLRSEEVVKQVADYVAALPAAKRGSSLSGGDAARGQASYALCASCHGAQGEGVQALNGPPLAHQSDWYLLSQMQKFQQGLRGANLKDAEGILMRPMSMTIPDEQGLKDVIAYIQTLPE